MSWRPLSESRNCQARVPRTDTGSAARGTLERWSMEVYMTRWKCVECVGAVKRTNFRSLNGGSSVFNTPRNLNAPGVWSHGPQRKGGPSASRARKRIERLGRSRAVDGSASPHSSSRSSDRRAAGYPPAPAAWPSPLLLTTFADRSIYLSISVYHVCV